MALNLGKAVVDYPTAHPDENFSARQVAEGILATFPDECQARKDSSQALETDADLLQQLVAEIGIQCPCLQKKRPHPKTTEGRRRKYHGMTQEKPRMPGYFNARVRGCPGVRQCFLRPLSGLSVLRGLPAGWSFRCRSGAARFSASR